AGAGLTSDEDRYERSFESFEGREDTPHRRARTDHAPKRVRGVQRDAERLGIRVDHDGRLADVDPGAGREDRAVDPLAEVVGPVAAPEVAHAYAGLVELELEMVSRYPRVGDDEVGRRRGANDALALFQTERRDSRCAENRCQRASGPVTANDLRGLGRRGG